MEINRYFYLFSFKPERLTEERVKMQKKYSSREAELLKHRGKILLPKLLEIIRHTSIEQIPDFAKDLKRIEVLLLIHEGYPFTEESEETITKINAVLLQRYSTAIGRAAWTLFQHSFKNDRLQKLLRTVYRQEGFSFLNMNSDLKERLNLTIGHRDGLSQGIVSAILLANLKTSEAFDMMKIEEEAKLETVLMEDILVQGLPHDRFIEREGSGFITRVLANYPMDTYKKIIKFYLKTRNYQQFHVAIVQQAVDRLRDPRERTVDWEFLSESVVSEVKRWLIQKKLQIIFENDQDNKRLNYWKRFIDYMEDVELIQNPMIAFIYFDEFVIVEYGNMGAAYFYHREGFEKVIYPISVSESFKNSRSQQTKEGKLKLPYYQWNGSPLFINKLHHNGKNWQDKFDQSMTSYLKGKF